MVSGDTLPSPTPRELEILKVLWDLGPATVAEVYRRLRDRREPDGADPKPQAQNTIQTLMRIMATKGLLTYEIQGRTFIYRPCYSRDESAARFLDRVFDGAASQLVQSLLKSEKIPAAELDALHTMIAQARRTEPGGSSHE
jgi:predicted transcriptional regulator